MILKTIGERAWKYGLAVATLSFTPLYDRAAKVINIRVTAPSAADTWVVSVGSKEIFRAPVDVVGNQHIFGQVEQSSPIFWTLFSYVKQRLNRDMSIPVPNGQTITVSSVGGATANISLEFEEWDKASVTGSELNGQESRHFLIPTFAYLNAAPAAAGTFALDTRIASSYVPNYYLAPAGFSSATFPVGWRAQLHGLWLDATSVNTFSGAANHVSQTNYLQVQLNSQIMFTRDNTGIPMPAAAAAAGSANTSYLGSLENITDFDHSIFIDRNIFHTPIDIHGGDTLYWALNLTGDFTGNPSYAHSYIMTLAEIWQI